MTEYTLDDFYSVIREIVMHMKAAKECHRVNSFAVANSRADLTQEIAKERGAYYWSRDNSQLVYPLLAVSESFPMLDDYRSGRYVRNCMVMEIGIIDQYFDGCNDCDECGKRSIEQIKHDTIDLLNKVISEISNIKLYLTQPGNVLKYSVQGIIDQMIADGEIISATIKNPESSALKKTWKEENQSKRAVPFTNKSAMLYGNFIVITICKICNDNTVEYKIKNIEKVGCC